MSYLIYNVIRGQMSLVGPRPEREHFVEQFKDQIPLYMRRLRVRPDYRMGTGKMEI